MSNTIEALEIIGRDASLRHASRENLMQVLAGMDASEGLKMAATSGDRRHLAQELGQKINQVSQVNQNPHDGGCDPCEDDMENQPERDGDGTDGPELPDR